MIAPDEVVPALARRLGTGPGRWEERVLGDTPGVRRVVACTFHPPLGDPPVQAVAKAYCDATGERTARVMTALRDALADRAEASSPAVPRPLFYDRERHLLVQELVTGTPYLDLARGDGAEAHLRAAGAAVGTLHALAVPLGRARRIADHLDELVRPHPLELAERVPDVAARIKAVVDELLRWEAATRGAVAPAPVHRDLHLRQLLRDGQRVWVLDWDLAAAGDPALDVGNLVATMTTKLAPARAAACADALLDGYAPRDRTGAIARRAPYEAFTYLRLACKRFRLAPPGWRAAVDELLARAEEALAA